MKRAYEKPVALANEELMEGVYMTSGDTTGSDCYTVTAHIHQPPETGREDYRIQVDAVHAAKHHGDHQTLVISFNQPVQFSYCNGKGATLAGGDGTSTLRIDFTYHQNQNDNIGLGDLVVTSNDGLAITGAQMICGKTCGQHSEYDNL